jgi:phosphatidate cytidylyltransferase
MVGPTFKTWGDHPAIKEPVPQCDAGWWARRLRQWPDANLMKRVATAAVAIPIVILLIVFSPDWLFTFITGLVGAVAVEEFLSLAEKKGIARPGRWILAPAALVTFAFAGTPGRVLAALVSVVLLLMTTTIFTGPLETALARVSMGLGGILYCSVTLGFLLMIPRDLILILLAIIWIGDTAAYYGGRAFGRHLLAPKVSPKKTIEGAIAGLLGAVAAGIIGGSVLTAEPLLLLAGMSAATAIAGQLGDLAESVLKRSAGVKDSSSILPGHGGILDRLDSLFFAAPVFYWFFSK